MRWRAWSRAVCCSCGAEWQGGPTPSPASMAIVATRSWDRGLPARTPSHSKSGQDARGPREVALKGAADAKCPAALPFPPARSAAGEGAAKRRMGGLRRLRIQSRGWRHLHALQPPSVSQLRCDPPSPSTRSALVGRAMIMGRKLLGETTNSSVALCLRIKMVSDPISILSCYVIVSDFNSCPLRFKTYNFPGCDFLSFPQRYRLAD